MKRQLIITLIATAYLFHGVAHAQNGSAEWLQNKDLMLEVDEREIRDATQHVDVEFFNDTKPEMRIQFARSYKRWFDDLSTDFEDNRSVRLVMLNQARFRGEPINDYLKFVSFSQRVQFAKDWWHKRMPLDTASSKEKQSKTKSEKWFVDSLEYALKYNHHLDISILTQQLKAAPISEEVESIKRLLSEDASFKYQLAIILNKTEGQPAIKN